MGFHWISSKTETRESSISGKGLFAVENIKKDELMVVFGGYVMSVGEWRALPDDVREEVIQIHENFLIGAKKTEELGDGDYVNHSCNPNTGIKGQVVLVAMRDIEKDEEITFDYATVVSGIDFKMKCNCGSKNCRKIMTSDDWKKPELQKKYKGYFSYYLEEKMI
ncbi:SET domain-containing protein-lysine N-methyltransferase [Candidatus Woesearchaeota archaeon]|nr:SET domain-containing protein-lysine N-methyltransferase [Candidatus Woesearchaeota archaeon]